MYSSSAYKIIFSFFVFVLISLFPMRSINAAEDKAAMEERIEALEREVAELKALLKEQSQQAATKEEVAAVKKEVQQSATKEEVAAVKQEAVLHRKWEANEWKHYDSTVHLGGYGAVSYTDYDHANDRFNMVSYNPIFHYTYQDLLMLEAELEIAVAEDGETEVGLEYSTIDWFLNDYMTLLAGKFLSPVGFFRQNLHPAWVNKMPTAPPGFGHDEAAPVADVGVELRGGFPIGNPMYANYALFVTNGPNELELNEDMDEIEAVETAGATGNEDENFLFGGRLGFIPIPNVEIGISGAFGDVALEDEQDRDYDVIDVDAFGRWRDLDFRAEYVRSRVGSLSSSIAPESQKWEAWYVQGSYKLSRFQNRILNHLEAVVRYADYDSNHADQEKEQWALGLNYLIAPQGMVKFAYEFNKGLRGEPTDEDRLLIQLAYGF